MISADKELEGVGQLISDIVLTLLSWMRDGEIFVQPKGKQRKDHAGATGKDRSIYNRVVELLEKSVSVMDIHKEVGWRETRAI